MRNPNGYGSVAKLSGNRRRPFIVKKVTGWKNNGQPVYSIIGYTETREAGNILLAEYNRDPWDADPAYRRGDCGAVETSVGAVGRCGADSRLQWLADQ